MAARTWTEEALDRQMGLFVLLQIRWSSERQRADRALFRLLSGMYSHMVLEVIATGQDSTAFLALELLRGHAGVAPWLVDRAIETLVILGIVQFW